MYRKLFAGLLFPLLLVAQNIDSTRVRYMEPAFQNTRTVFSKLADWRSVKDYGAVANGFTDDSLAFIEAVNSIPVGGYGVVYCPDAASPYRLASNVTVTGRTVTFLLSTGCRLTGTGTLPISYVKFSSTSLDIGGALSTTGGITAGGAFSGTSGAFSGALSAAGITGTSLGLGTGTITSGAITSGAVTASGAVIGTSLSTSGNGALNLGTGSITSGAITASGGITGTSLTTTSNGALNLGTGSITSGAITASGQVASSSGGFKFPDNSVQISASYTPFVTTQTANYSVSISTNGKWQEIVCNGTFTVTLDTAVGNSGAVTTIKNKGTGVITLNTTSAQTIDGQASGAITIVRQWDSISMISDGSNWLIF